MNWWGNSQPKEPQDDLMSHPRDWSWPFWFTLPLYPYRQRRTLCREVLENTIWCFEQLHGILYTVIPIRMTVVRLAAGGLLVYAPIAPTPECIRLVKTLVAKYGEVKYIILPTASGLEHKVFVGPFARCFPTAQVFVAPHQWSFPVNLPLSWLGFPQQRTQILPSSSQQVPFADEFDYAVLDIDLGRGSFVEVALLHKASRTLLVTDTILAIGEQPPAIAQLDPYPLLFHARDSAAEPIENTEANRRKGWQRIALFAVYFRPAPLEPIGPGQTVRDAIKAPDRSRKAYFGLFPFRWRSDWQRSFEALRVNGRPFVAPVLQTLILPQAPQSVIDWANQITAWDFCRIIPCHFDAPIPATPLQFRQAFTFLERKSVEGGSHAGIDPSVLPEIDVAFIKNIEKKLLDWGIAKPPKARI
jgi:hypothetical protein